MRFDLFDAIRHMQKEFGLDGEILVYPRMNGVAVRLRVLVGDVLSYEFTVSNAEIISDSNVNVTNEKFKLAIRVLSEKIKRDAMLGQERGKHRGESW